MWTKVKYVSMKKLKWENQNRNFSIDIPEHMLENFVVQHWNDCSCFSHPCAYFPEQSNVLSLSLSLCVLWLVVCGAFPGGRYRAQCCFSCLPAKCVIDVVIDDIFYWVWVWEFDALWWRHEHDGRVRKWKRKFRTFALIYYV